MTPLRAHDFAQAASLPRAACAEPLRGLTLREAARELRCSRTQLYKILCGKVPDLPSLPVFHIGRRTLIRRVSLRDWIRSLEQPEREARYASGYIGLDEDWESVSGA